VRTALVFAAAPLQPTARLRARLAEVKAPYVIAADEGAATALAFGYQPDVVIGDLDSLNAATREELERRGVAFETYPRDKDFTDGQLAVERALQIQPIAVWLLGFLGGPRLDQSVANVLLLARIEAQVVVLDEMNECVLIRPPSEVRWRPAPNEIVSLIPLGGDVSHVITRGLRWPLTGDTLHLGDTRGLSNEPVSDEVSVSIGSGHVLLTRHFPSTARI
jgi:thiamine pyrophosphokinase